MQAEKLQFELYEKKVSEGLTDLEANIYLLYEFMKDHDLRFLENPYINDKIKDGDNVEVYELATTTQQWRSPNFYNLTSYSIDTLTSTPFHELYHRDETVVSDIMERVQTCVVQKRNLDFNIPIHSLVELAGNRTFLIKMGIVCPIVNLDSNQVTHVFVSNRPVETQIRPV